MSSAKQSSSASFADGLNWFFSIDMMVCLVVPTIFASSSKVEISPRTHFVRLGEMTTMGRAFVWSK